MSQIKGMQHMHEFSCTTCTVCRQDVCSTCMNFPVPHAQCVDRMSHRIKKCSYEIITHIQSTGLLIIPIVHTCTRSECMTKDRASKFLWRLYVTYVPKNCTSVTLFPITIKREVRKYKAECLTFGKPIYILE